MLCMVLIISSVSVLAATKELGAYSDVYATNVYIEGKSDLGGQGVTIVFLNKDDEVGYVDEIQANADGTYDKIYKNYKAELGLTLKGAINYTYKDLKIITSVGLFTPYAWDKTKMFDAEKNFIGYRDNNRRFGNFDVDWDAAISYQFLKCLNVTLSTSLKYYNGVKIADAEGNLAERVQFKGTLGIGVGYSF